MRDLSVWTYVQEEIVTNEWIFMYDYTNYKPCLPGKCCFRRTCIHGSMWLLIFWLHKMPVLEYTSGKAIDG